jgi:hypothetical protein
LSHYLKIIAPAEIFTEEKLNLLNQVDRWRRWQSLEDRRLCLGCGRMITGDEIEIIQPRENGALEAHCPTRGCQSIPLDWIFAQSA